MEEVMKQLICILLLLYSCNSVTKGDESSGLLINEVMSRNCSASGIAAPNGKYEDWIELYNGGSDTLLLSEYFLSDTPDDAYKAPLPSVKLAPGEYITLWCGEKTSLDGPFLGFNLSGKTGSGECVQLSHRTTGVIDSCHYSNCSDALKRGKSFGRVPDGGARWSQQHYPSPGASNNG